MEILGKLENFGKYWIFFGKFRIIISKVGGELWRREGYIGRKSGGVKFLTNIMPEYRVMMFRILLDLKNISLAFLAENGKWLSSRS